MTPEQNPNVDRIGPVLRALREGAGMSARGLAKAADVTHPHLLRVESGERAISPELLHKVLRAIADHLLRRGEAA
jgi:transcriptional regulator with XRE-family HTH domain